MRKRPDNHRPLSYVLLKKFGIAGALQVIRDDVVFDVRHGIDTAMPVAQRKLFPAETHHEQNRYVASTFNVLHGVLQFLSTQIEFSEAGFVDLGSGKGKALIAASDYGFRSVRGVEVSDRMITVCNDNLLRIGLDRRVNILHVSAADFRPEAHERVFYLFNSFTGLVLQRCVDNLLRAPREGPALLAYVNPTEQDYLDQVLSPVHTTFLQPGNCEVRYYRIP